MKRFLALAILLAALPAFGQQISNPIPFTAVSPPAAPTISSLSGTSPTGKIYTGTKMAVIGTGFSASCFVNVDGTAQAGTTFVFVSAAEIDFTIPAALGSSAGILHNLTVSCPVPVLAMNSNSPVLLPNGKAGQAYSADLVKLSNLSGGVSPYKCSLLSGSLPTGLNLSQSCVVSGTTLSTGSFSFSYTVADSSGLTKTFTVNEGALTEMRPAVVRRVMAFAKQEPVSN